jgi:hypothetical protein
VTRKIVGRGGEHYHVFDIQGILAFQVERELVWIVTSSQRLRGNQTVRA